MRDPLVERARGRGPRSLCWLGALAASALVLGAAPPGTHRAWVDVAPAAALAAEDGAQEPPHARPPRESVLEPVEPPEFRGDALTALSHSTEQPPEVGELKARIVRGDASSSAMGGAIKALQKLTYKHPRDAELVYLLGQLYLNRLWVGDGLKALRRAIELEPLYRSNPFLIRAAINRLGNDRDQAQVRRFLVSEIGRPAAPYLEEVLHGEWRAQVKERAAAILAEVSSAAP